MLELTQKAEDALRRFADSAGEPVSGLRISVVDGGCSGLQYAMSLEAAPREGDHVVQCGAMKVFIEAESAEALAGATVDYVESLEGAGFTFDNPNAARFCACGKSFAC